MSANLTKKQILAAVAARTGINIEYIDLTKSDGEWFWGGKAGCCFSSMATFAKLNDVSLSRWVEDFEWRVSETSSSLGMGLNDYIETIDWEDI